MTLATDTSGDNLFHNYFIDIEINGTTHYISDCYREVSYLAKTYSPLGYLMGVSDISSGLNPSEVNTAIVVSGVGDVVDFKTLALSNKSKGGTVTIRRGLSAVSDYDIINNQKIYTMFKGFVRNIGFTEDLSEFGVDIKDTLVFECSNMWNSKRQLTNGRKTNPEDFNEYTKNTLNYPRDPVMDRVSFINGKKFAFGRSA